MVTSRELERAMDLLLLVVDAGGTFMVKGDGEIHLAFNVQMLVEGTSVGPLTSETPEGFIASIHEAYKTLVDGGHLELPTR